jgi:hypothetical protein
MKSFHEMAGNDRLTLSTSGGAQSRPRNAVVRRSKHAASKQAPCLSNDRTHFASLRRGRRFAALDWIMSLPRPVDGNGTLALSIAETISASTSGCAN